ncbi:MAG: FtsQ-type POTRA domain-containing protein [Gemmatimonadota bacterium]|jgi:cell division protein FtsQ
MKRPFTASTRQAILLAVLSVELAAVATVYGAGWLRHLDVFRVRRVEVVGNRYVRAATALRVSGITAGANLFDDMSVVRDRLLRLRMVRSVRVQRRLPGTVVIRIAEVHPAALVPVPELQPVDSDGRVLPVDPAGLSIDLPVVDVPTTADAQGWLVDSAAVGLVRLAARLQREAPQIAARVSTLAVGSDGITLTLRRPEDARVVLPAVPRRLHYVELQVALNDLAARGELDRVRSIDLRYRDQAIIAFGI